MFETCNMIFVFGPKILSIQGRETQYNILNRLLVITSNIALNKLEEYISHNSTLQSLKVYEHVKQLTFNIKYTYSNQRTKFRGLRAKLF